jgi:GT2 family glycosyltransferase
MNSVLYRQTGLNMQANNITVCICTRNRPDELRKCLDSLARCEPAPSQVIVSDDSAATDLQSEALCWQYPRVEYQRGPRSGLSANRNACLRECRSDWIHFIDDDVVVDAGFYAKCGNLLPTLEPRTIVTGCERNFLRRHPFKVRPRRHGFWILMLPARKTKFNCVVINATLFPRSLFDQIEFDEFFKYGCEESDISLHAASIGYRLVYADDLSVDHHPAAANRDVYRGWLVASQVYAGLKRQWNYKHSYVRTVAFAAVAVPRLLLHTLRRKGLKAFVDATQQAGRGFVHFLEVQQLPQHQPTLEIAKR